MHSKLIVLFIVVLIIQQPVRAQAPVDVVESTLKVGLMGEEIFYLGFAEGDKMLFSFEEANGKELKEVEIVELPATSRFIDFKTSRITNKTISVKTTGIYKFRFTNSSIGVRICKYKIQRIPASAATQHFNTTVYTHVVNDTTWVDEEEDFLANTDTVFSTFQDRIIKVGAVSGPGSNKASFNFVIPENTVGWSFYISTDKAGQDVFTEANAGLTTSSAAVIKKFPQYNLLSALALNRPVAINKLHSGEDIGYWILDADNVTLFNAGQQFKYIKKGKAINDFARMEPRKGSFYFCFSNDNPTEPVTVTVKIGVAQANEAFEVRKGKRMITTPKTKMYLKN